MRFKLEICCFSVEAALIAQQAGAVRVELCASPAEGGTTPSQGAIRMAREKLHIQLYPIIRPRGGDFLYSRQEFEVMQSDILFCRQMGCDGVVIGMLNPDGRVNREEAARLIESAYPMGVTFHRAFDWAIDPMEALETIISLGCERILTSGQQPVAIQGADLRKELIRQAAERIIIMPGSGLRAANISELAQKTGAREFHTSARINQASRMGYLNKQMQETLETPLPDPAEIREIIRLLQNLE